MIYKMFISLMVVFVLLSGCGQKEVKPEEKATTTQEKKTELKKEYDPMEDTSFNNVMKVLKEALDTEKTESTSSARLNTAKAYILVIKFLNTDKESVRKSGMTDEDIAILKADAKEKAAERLNDIIGSQTAPEKIKEEAKAKLEELKKL